MPPSRKNHSDEIPVWGKWLIASFIIIPLAAFLISAGAIPKAGHFLSVKIGNTFDWIGSLLPGATSLLFFASLICLYFYPTILGQPSKRRSAIFLTNLFFGWTLIGWIIALIWATAEKGSLQPPTPPPRSRWPE